MLDPVDQPFLAVLQAQGRERGEPGADAPDRRALSEVPVLRLASDGPPARPGRPSGRPAPGAAADAADGLASDPSAAPDQRGASRASDLSLSSAGYDDRSAEPGLVRRHHLHPGPSRLHVSGGDHGLGDAPCPGLAAVEHAGRRLLHRRARRGVGQVRQAGDLQHRSGQPVHRRRLHRAITGGGGEDLDGRQGRWLDNVFIERLWRSLKYEAVYLRELADGFEAERVIDEWMAFYNAERPHSALAGRTPAEAYRGKEPVDMMDKPLRALTTFPLAQQQQDG